MYKNLQASSGRIFRDYYFNQLSFFFLDNISPMKKLRGGVIFVDQLPKTSTGKVNRKELKQWVAAES